MTMGRNEKMKIAIVGAGVVGSLVGGFMALGGEDVTLIGKGEHVRAINENGLHIDGVKGAYTVPIAAFETLDFKPDMVFLAVKTQDVESACESIKDRPGTRLS
jgi:2-dehydropantoate 2-reductase